MTQCQVLCQLLGQQRHQVRTDDEKGNSLWNILPSFDPQVDDPREYKDKVLFLHGICPKKDRAMLAPRLAMMMKRDGMGSGETVGHRTAVGSGEGHQGPACQQSRSGKKLRKCSSTTSSKRHSTEQPRGVMRRPRAM